MAEFVKLKSSGLAPLRKIDGRLVSYNVEMTEVTGGTFWKAYTDAQVDGTEEFPMISDWRDMGNLQQWYDPIDLYNPRLCKMARELSTAWVRVSGTWANKTLIINNSRTDTTTVELPHASSAYVLEGQGKLRSRVMTLNGKPLTLDENDEIPTLDPGACAFVLV